MGRVKVMLATKPRLLRESLTDLIQRQTDMEMVGEVFEPIELLWAVGETNADVVVMALPDTNEDPGICSHLLAEYPQLLIIAVSRERDRAFLYQRRPTKELLLRPSNEEILTAIREAVEE